MNLPAIKSLSYLIILFVSNGAHVTAGTVIFDVSQLVKNALSNGTEHKKAQDSLNTFVSKNEQVSSDILLYFESGKFIII